MNELRTPSDSEHRMFLAAEKSVLFYRIILTGLFLIVVFGVLSYVKRQTAAPVEETVKVEGDARYLEGFTDTEESIIKELYGDRTAYADDKTWHTKTDFIDKEATAKTGEITYDEEAYQAFYDSFLAEYDAMVDHEKVTALYNERKETYIALKKSAENAFGKKDKQNVLGGKVVVLTVLLIAVCVVWCGIAVLRFFSIAKRDYLIAEGTVVKKLSRRGRINIIKPFAVVSYGNAEAKVRLIVPQSLVIGEYEKVYLAELGNGLPAGTLRYSICKR